jgi:hypothetical protein
MTKVNLLTPAGRLVKGSLYKPTEKDADGNPLVVKNGPNKGQPRVDFYFALAIPKTPGQTAWWTKPTGWDQQFPNMPYWGEVILAAGQTAFPQACGGPTFAWKVKDGDSTIPNSKGKSPSQQEGHPGCWVLSFSGGYAPKVTKDNGTVHLPQPDAVNLGDWVQVFGSVDGNGSQQRPGLFLNHSMVNFIGFGDRIVVGPDAASVGFGVGIAMPAGASAAPPATMTPAAAAGAAPQMPGVTAVPPAMPGVPAMPGGAPQTPGVAVAPNAGFVAGPGGVPAMPGVPAAPAVPVAPPARQLTAKAMGATYEQLLGGGWTDQTLVQHGLMLA